MNISEFDNRQDLFFVSGMFAGSWIWQDACKNIPNARQWIIKEPLCDLSLNLSEISQTVADKLKNLGGSTTLVGNSLGSVICLKAAALCPDRVKKVIISGSAGFGRIKLDVKLSPHTPKTTAQTLIDMVYYNRDRISQLAYDETTKCFSESFRNIIKLIRESNSVDAKELLTEVKCPVHAIWGSHDVITPLCQAQGDLDSLGVSSTVIDECGHSPMCEKPEEFASLVNKYIN